MNEEERKQVRRERMKIDRKNGKERGKEKGRKTSGRSDAQKLTDS